ncbi:MAG: hypothetical protein K1X67_15825 [Fimbriimonadaceae bacterium]|nr:hypothetical protein [Fimbriimonadaceae bacterium]
MKLRTTLLALALLGGLSSAKAATISGTVSFTGWNAPVVGIQLEMYIVDWSLQQLVDYGTFTVGIGGTYTYVTNASIPPGTYDLYVNGDRWLQQDSANVSVGATAVANYNLIPGDVENDEAVDIADYARVHFAMWSTSGSVNWDPYADLDGDGWVDMMDYSLVSYYYGMVGDTFY